MSRIALLGGSFNPPHVAHQMIALEMLTTREIDAVWMMPCNQHPFGKELMSFRHRLHMCRLAAECFAPESVEVSRVEEEMGGESRTYDTIDHLIRHHPEHQFHLVVGSDILEERSAWYRFDAIEEMVEVIVVPRSGYPVDPPLEGAGRPALPAVSSSMIRRRLARGEDVSGFVPTAVLAYIREHRLFGT